MIEKRLSLDAIEQHADRRLVLRHLSQRRVAVAVQSLGSIEQQRSSRVVLGQRIGRRHVCADIARRVNRHRQFGQMHCSNTADIVAINSTDTGSWDTEMISMSRIDMSTPLLHARGRTADEPGTLQIQAALEKPARVIFGINSDGIDDDCDLVMAGHVTVLKAADDIEVKPIRLELSRRNPGAQCGGKPLQVRVDGDLHVTGNLVVGGTVTEKASAP
jgi:hypothetical protein